MLPPVVDVESRCASDEGLGEETPTSQRKLERQGRDWVAHLKLRHGEHLQQSAGDDLVDAGHERVELLARATEGFVVDQGAEKTAKGDGQLKNDERDMG